MARILLVEDNEMNRDMLSRRLQRRGFEVVIATDGGQGIEMAGSQNPDLILMDMSLPVVDGWEATRRIKAEEATQKIPIIALTAHAMAGDRDTTYAGTATSRSTGSHGVSATTSSARNRPKCTSALTELENVRLTLVPKSGVSSGT